MKPTPSEGVVEGPIDDEDTHDEDTRVLLDNFERMRINRQNEEKAEKTR